MYLLCEAHPAVEGVHAHCQIDGFQVNVAVLIEFRLPAAAAAKERGSAVFLFQDQIFLQRGNLFVRHEFLEAVLPFGGRGKDFDDQARLFTVVGRPIIGGAGDHDVRIIEDGLALYLHTDFHIGHKDLAVVWQLGVKQRAGIQGDQVMFVAGACHRIHDSIDVFVPDGAFSLAAQVVVFTDTFDALR